MFEFICWIVVANVAFYVGSLSGRQDGWKEHYQGKAQCETLFNKEVVCRATKP